MPVGGGETAKDVSGWTVDTVNARVDGVERTINARIDHVHREIAALMVESDKRYAQRFDSQEQAVRRADTATEKRFESVNEFRAQLGDQARQFLPRLEYDRAHADLVERVDQMRVTFSEHLTQIDRTLGEITARRGGGAEVWAYVVGAMGFVVGLIGIITRFV